MSKYEAVLVLSVKNGDEATQSLQEKFKALIEANGTLESVDEWGKRKLAYEINDRTEGYYVLVEFAAKPEFPKELERNYGIDENILRSIVVKKEVKE